MAYRNDPFGDFDRRLVVNKVRIEDGHRSKVILEVNTEELKALTTYWLEFGQPIPEKAESYPMYIRVFCDKCFAPRVTVDDPECCCKFDHGHSDEKCHEECMEREDCRCEEDEFDPNFAYGYPGDGRCREKCKVITIPVTKFGLGNVAFGEDVLGRCRGDYPRRRLKVYLTNDAKFTLLPRGY